MQLEAARPGQAVQAWHALPSSQAFCLGALHIGSQRACYDSACAIVRAAWTVLFTLITLLAVVHIELHALVLSQWHHRRAIPPSPNVSMATCAHHGQALHALAALPIGSHPAILQHCVIPTGAVEDAEHVWLHSPAHVDHAPALHDATLFLWVVCDSAVQHVLVVVAAGPQLHAAHPRSSGRVTFQGHRVHPSIPIPYNKCSSRLRCNNGELEGWLHYTQVVQVPLIAAHTGLLYTCSPHTIHAVFVLHTSGRQRDDGTVRVAFSRAVHAHGFLPVTPAPYDLHALRLPMPHKVSGNKWGGGLQVNGRLCGGLRGCILKECTWGQSGARAPVTLDWHSCACVATPIISSSPSCRSHQGHSWSCYFLTSGLALGPPKPRSMAVKVQLHEAYLIKYYS
mmetsp:Transcript_11729/g.30721  ORF Transcript_11729/g.30721 Transcript_11729/m.30721 type:complete len:396 (+) Transcript_11729:2327-3514(+)